MALMYTVYQKSNWYDIRVSQCSNYSDFCSIGYDMMMHSLVDRQTFSW